MRRWINKTASAIPKFEKKEEIIERLNQLKPAAYLRKRFSLTSEVRFARVYICGLGYYELYLNGEKVGDHALDPGQTDYEKRALYVTYDVTAALRKGSNDCRRHIG